MALVIKWIIIPKLSKDWTNVPSLEFLHTTIHVMNMKILILTLLRLNKNLLQFKLLGVHPKPNRAYALKVSNLHFSFTHCAPKWTSRGPEELHNQGLSIVSWMVSCKWHCCCILWAYLSPILFIFSSLQFSMLCNGIFSWANICILIDGWIWG